MNENHGCKTVLLSDIPINEDAFGSHENVAKAISELINTNAGGKSIALTGAWGSGKSTVIELMKKHLESETEVFIFDSWAHQGDPLRRTFLEQLIDFCINKKWIDRSFWTKKKKEISRKRTKQKITSSPRLTRQGKLFASSTLFVPVGLALVSTYSDTTSIWLLIFGLLLCLLPSLVLLVTFVNERTDGNHEVLSLVLNNSQTITNTKTLETPNPTSIEFQSSFKNLMACSLKFNHTRKLIIVIDNLDRVETTDALEIWATMRTFFDFNSNGSDEWIQRLWLIVPFDSTALEKLWHVDGNEYEEIEEGEKTNEGKSKKFIQSENKKLVQSFKDKSFQITFNVAPPILTDWGDFLKNKLSEAFPEHDSTEFHNIYRLYRLRGLSERGFPTPRDIILFINQIGALHRQWCDKIPLPTQALYVILQRYESNFYKKLIEEDILKDNEKQLVDTNYIKHIAALYFNVPIEKSLQVLLAKPIEKALYEGETSKIKDETSKIKEETSKIKELSKSTGFWQVCEHVIEEQYMYWSNNEGRTICLIANKLSNIEKIEDPSCRGVWNLLYNGANSINSLGILDQNVGSGLVNLFKYKQNDDFVIKIIQFAVDTTPRFEGNESNDVLDHRIKNWLNGVFVILKELLNSNSHNLIKEKFILECNASTYIEILSRIKYDSNWDEILPYFKPKSQPKEVISIIVKKLNEGSFDELYSNVIILMLKTEQKWPWADVTSVISSGLRNLNKKNLREVKASLTALINLDNKEIFAAEEVLKDLVLEGHLLNQIALFGDSMNLALCLVPILDINPEGDIQHHTGYTQEGLRIFNAIMTNPKNSSEVIENFAGLCKQYSLTGTIIKLPQRASKTSSFVRETIEYLAKDDDLHQLLSPSDIISVGKNLSDILSDPIYENLIIKSAKESSLIEILIQSNFNTEISRIYLTILKKVNNVSTQQLIEFIINGLRYVETETWLLELENSNNRYLLELLIEVEKLGNKLDLNTSLEDALLSYAELIIKEEREYNFLEKNSEFVYNALDSHSKITFLNRLLDEIITSDKATDNVLIIYGELLADCNILYKHADNLVLKGFKQFMERRRKEEIKWMMETLIKCPRIYSDREEELRTDFERRVINIWTDENVVEEVRGMLKRIANEFEIKLPNIKEYSLETNS